MGKGRSPFLTEEDYRTAYNIMWKSEETLIPAVEQINNPIGAKKVSKGIILPSMSNPEREAIKRELFEKLSKEAKEVISLVLNTPAEILDLISSPTLHSVNKYQLKDYLRKEKKYPITKVRSIFSELKEFVEAF